MLIGLFSWSLNSDQCVGSSYYPVFTKVSSYMDWFINQSSTTSVEPLDSGKSSLDSDESSADGDDSEQQRCGRDKVNRLGGKGIWILSRQVRGTL